MSWRKRTCEASSMTIIFLTSRRKWILHGRANIVNLWSNLLMNTLCNIWASRCQHCWGKNLRKKAEMVVTRSATGLPLVQKTVVVQSTHQISCVLCMMCICTCHCSRLASECGANPKKYQEKLPEAFDFLLYHLINKSIYLLVCLFIY